MEREVFKLTAIPLSRGFGRVTDLQFLSHCQTIHCGGCVPKNRHSYIACLFSWFGMHDSILIWFVIIVISLVMC